jgi:hypothetical protein
MVFQHPVCPHWGERAVSPFLQREVDGGLFPIRLPLSFFGGARFKD